MRNKIITAIFIMYILFFAIGSIIVKDRVFSDMENRNLTQFPKASAKSIFSGDYSDEFESYMSDQIIFKDFLVKLKVTENRTLNQTNVNNVYFADDMYIRDYKENTAQIDKNVGFVNEFAESNPDLSVTWLIAPNACYVYEDKLPSHTVVDSQGDTVNHIKDMVDASINLVDVSDDLIKNREGYIYYNTDPPWTMNGAYIGYKKLCEALEIEAVAESEYNIRVASDEFLGTLYSDAPVFNAKTDDIILYEKKGGSYTVNYEDEGFTQDSLYNYDNLLIKDKYQTYLDGNHAIIRIENNNYVSQGDKTGDRVIVVKDSYAHSLLPLLADNYKEIIVVDLRYYHEKTVSDLANEEGISDIILINNIDFINSDDNFLWLM